MGRGMKGINDNEPGRGEEQIEAVNEAVQAILHPEESRGFYPVYSIPLTKNNGIEITGTFRTSDSHEIGSASYVTVGREAGRTYVTEGIGFAWVKSIQVPLAWDDTGSVASSQYSFNIHVGDNSSLTAVSFLC